MGNCGFLESLQFYSCCQARSLTTAWAIGAHPEERQAARKPSTPASHCLSPCSNTGSFHTVLNTTEIPLLPYNIHKYALIHAQDYLWLSLIPKLQLMVQQMGPIALHTKQLFPVLNFITSRFLYAKFMQTNAFLANSFVSIFMTTDTYIMQ